MAYQFEVDENTDAGVRRIVRERIDDAMKQLDRTGDKQHKGIHEARKGCKEIRAVLRLARRPLGRHYRSENAAFRDVARGLASSRDAQAVVEAWDALRERFGERLAKDGDAIRQRLIARRNALLAESGDIGVSLGTAREALLQARSRIDDWPEIPAFSDLAPGAARCYRHGGARLRDAQRGPSIEVLHEWRKRAKDYWYHTCLLRGVWPGIMTAWRRELKTLSDCLGDDHDLMVLRAALLAEPERYGGEERLTSPL
ncbi:CHAD domain-containing protein, partial [Aquisalimonas sp.]|uniref:CHAD domain-containing protein n=1 Tax=Aquisalimonas sp. TaxID=1872621 RepID=UPI0025B9D2D0